VNVRIREIKEGYWESFTADMEHDIHGAQKKVWKLIRRTKKEVNELVINNKITIDEWETFFCELYREDIPLSKEDIEKELRSLKNRKSPGPDGIFNEMLKYGSTKLTLHLTELFHKFLNYAPFLKLGNKVQLFRCLKKEVKQTQTTIPRNSTIKHYPKTIY